MPISDQIKVSKVYSKEKESYTFSFTISGRAPTLISDGQGDHVTAIALLEKGIVRFLENITFQEESDLDQVRQVRDKQILDNYIARVLAIDLDKREEFIETLPDIQEEYNILRVKKEDIGNCKILLDSLKKEESPNFAYINSLQTLIKKAFSSNVDHMCTEIGKMAKSFLTQYNKIPGIAFERIPDMPAPASEGSDIREALKYLDGKDKETEELKRVIEILERDLEWLCIEDTQKDSEENQEKLKRLIARERGVYESTVTVGKGRNYSGHLEKQQNETKSKLGKTVETLNNHRQNPRIIAENLSKLFFYPRVPEHYAQKTQKLLESGMNISIRRNNNLERFYYFMARHLYIAFAVYPHLYREEVIESFIKVNLTKWNMDIRMSKEVKEDLVKNISQFGKNIESITESEGYQSRRSSIDEGETAIESSGEEVVPAPEEKEENYHSSLRC